MEHWCQPIYPFIAKYSLKHHYSCIDQAVTENELAKAGTERRDDDDAGGVSGRSTCDDETLGADDGDDDDDEWEQRSRGESAANSREMLIH